MISALDCFQHAAKCEQMALAASDDPSRTVLLATAGHWRTLGKRGQNAGAVRHKSRHAPQASSTTAEAKGRAGDPKGSEESQIDRHGERSRTTVRNNGSNTTPRLHGNVIVFLGLSEMLVQDRTVHALLRHCDVKGSA
jgi:hypothetical protein